MAPTKYSNAKGQPNKPADRSSSLGLVSGEATMNAMTGAQGASAAIMPRTTAVVPQEQNGVNVALAHARESGVERRM